MTSFHVGFLFFVFVFGDSSNGEISEGAFGEIWVCTWGQVHQGRTL